MTIIWCVKIIINSIDIDQESDRPCIDYKKNISWHENYVVPHIILMSHATLSVQYKIK